MTILDIKATDNGAYIVYTEDGVEKEMHLSYANLNRLYYIREAQFDEEDVEGCLEEYLQDRNLTEDERKFLAGDISAICSTYRDIRNNSSSWTDDCYEAIDEELSNYRWRKKKDSAMEEI